MKKMSREEFIHRSRIVHGNIFNYDDIVWVNARTAVNIICPIHGEFNIVPFWHYSKHRSFGCPQCGRDYRNKKLSNTNRTRNLKTTQEFITKAKEIHGDKYNYIKTNYNGNQVPVCIICPTHGEFFQRPDKHIGKIPSNCPQCSNKSRKLKLKGQYTEDYFLNNPSEQYVPANLYFVKMFSDNETFYKIGITKTKIKTRFKSGYQTYNMRVISFVKTTLHVAYQTEQYILNKFTKNQYFPSKKFGGWTECFTLSETEAQTIINEIQTV